ncbi:probable serine/threonine-protein kinase fhkD [Homalodisca vitripennis]|uniref:probable serine/threonine-protein kinase fhkD n=1 Tax=Homalodisca vitripennis TaxID=197043 RepID=UPI001EEAC121|nr:probable serine/threonine-protein kinase fhkD [Homalodisca vitripennis]
MIVYPPPVTMATRRGVHPRFLKKMTNIKTPKRQVVQWKQTNVEHGVVIVDEKQLLKLIKTEPIEKYYDLDPEPFATGLFANVRRCRSRETGEVFAAKFSSRARYGEDCTQEIHHEIALLSLCSPSPRIVRLHDVFQSSKEVIIVMEFAPGGDMQTIIDDNLVPFESDVVKFVQHVVEGLAYLHHRKIVHLDIKPQNLVMMGDFPDCDVKVCDFEISRVIVEGTEIREILGTPEYVAPEILHYEPITLAADMWSLGVTTYVLLTGFSPFGGETDQETFLNISQAALDFPDELFEDISDDAKDFIKRLLVRDPKSRMTARECLRHRWLASNRKPNGTKTSPRPDTISSPDPARRVGCSSCPPSTNQKNLRKYLSKSREALFEKVISRSKDLPQENLRKSTLMSRYNKTRRMCESQMSLVSKSRERLLMSDQQSMMAQNLHRSREKLYGLRSLSKSHEVLNLCKTVGALNSDFSVPESSPLRGILKKLTRATTTDFSTLAGEIKERNSNCSSTSSLNEKDKTNPEKASKEQLDKETSNSATTCSETEKSSKQDLAIPPEVQPLQSVLTFMCNNNINNEPKNDSSKNEDCNKENVAVDNHETGEFIEVKKEDEITHEKKEKHRPPPLFTKQLSILQSDDDPQSPEANLDSLSLTEGTSTSCSEISDEDAGSLERITGDISTEEDEPRYTVAQLISAYNLHQEIVTKCSLEVTMNAENVETKIPPLIERVPNKKFPTGPNALRLFIPNIDIASRCTKRTARKKPTMRPAPKRIEEITEETKDNIESNTPSGPLTLSENLICENSLTDSKSPDKIVKSLSIDVVKSVPLKYKVEKSESKEKCRLSSDNLPRNFVRSSSISSEASFKSSGASSNVTTSMEELSPNERKPRSNRSSGIASSDGDQSVDTWGRALNSTAGSSRTSDKSSHTTPRPNRKSFCSPRGPVIHTDSKTRRKSSPIMKPFY